MTDTNQRQLGNGVKSRISCSFKSAISVSLDPFRDLIARMQKDGHETAFVEHLVSEIFDNPTKRLYNVPSEKVEKSDVDIVGLVKEALDKIPKQN